MVIAPTTPRNPSGLNVFRTRLGVLAVIFSLAFLLVLARLAQLQIVRGAENRAAAQKMLTEAHLFPAGRGQILDRAGRVLALDEPSSNLDPRHRRDLIGLLKKIRLTKIIATHDLDLVLEICERVAVLDGGRIVAVGPARDILADKPLLAKHNL